MDLDSHGSRDELQRVCRKQGDQKARCGFQSFTLNNYLLIPSPMNIVEVPLTRMKRHLKGKKNQEDVVTNSK